MPTIEEKVEDVETSLSQGVDPLYMGKEVDNDLNAYSTERCRCPCPVISAPIYAAGLLMFDPLN